MNPVAKPGVTCAALGLLLASAGLAETPSQAVSAFTLDPGLSAELAVGEPDLAQPVYLTFDERGRMWVVQYLQFPFPAGLSVVGHDEYWRVQYDHFPPPPPPRHVPGADKVTIFEDRHGDGHFEKVRDFVTGLNICTAALPGRGGVWIMNPPYLLFYPDANRDDVPDGDPVVHLEGFGLEDLHAVANSLTWGPDGWLYGCQGSTCTATIRRPGIDREGVSFKGQCIWRYHPETRRFELFAEGGFNNFGIAFDNAFNLFTGSNGGIIGVHYVPHGFYRKIWGKHGPLTNPYALGWFEGMKDQSSQAKLSQAMIVYEANALPREYRHQMLVARVLQRRIDLCQLTPDGSTYAAREVRPILSSSEGRFRPVDLKIGPEGAVYIADWNEDNVTWNVTAEGKPLQKSTGRIYRLASTGTPHFKPFDLAQRSSADLLPLLSHANIWQRQMAMRLLWDRRDPTLAPEIRRLAKDPTALPALETVWATTATRGFDAEFAAQELVHPDPLVREWAIRLVGDEGLLDAPIRERLTALARDEPHPRVRSQLACTARTLPTPLALPIVRHLAARTEDENDPHLPLLLWWVVEAKLRADPKEVFTWLEDRALWSAPLFRKAIIARLAERFTFDRTSAGFEACARLLRLAPNARAVTQLIAGMTRGLAGNRVQSIPGALADELARLEETHRTNSEFLLLGLRLGRAEAVRAAVSLVGDAGAPQAQRLELLRLLAESGAPATIEPALALLRDPQQTALHTGAIEALQRFGQENVGSAILDAWPAMDQGLRLKALTILASRPSWARLLMDALARQKLAARDVPLDVVAALRGSKDTDISANARNLWGKGGASSEEKQHRFKELAAMLGRTRGKPDDSGRALFTQLCATCHTLFGEGGHVGPDLTGIDRGNRDNLLRAILEPSEVILPEFQGWELTLKEPGNDDEQTITGFLENETPNAATLRNAAGTSLVIPKSNIAQRRPMTVSIMPEGLIEPLTATQIADLFAYLGSQPASAPNHAGRP